MFGRLGRSARAKILARMFFGLLGATLGVIGAIHFASRPNLTTNHALRGSMIGMMLFFAAFWLFNVAGYRTWRWPAVGVVGCFVAMFVTRIALGP